MSELKFYELKCQRCGGKLLPQSDDMYVCESCGKAFERHIVSGVAEQLSGVLDVQKQEAVANLRQLLWKQTHAENVSNNKVEELCNKILAYLPEDFYANFYLATCSKSKSALSAFLSSVDTDSRYDDIPDLLNYILNGLRQEWTMAAGNFIERAYKNNDLDLYNKYRTRFEEISAKLEDGVFEPAMPRDVFIAYSSKDMPKVEALAAALEQAGLSCFVAARNLRHGSGAVENYTAALHTAIEHCAVIVFVSSENSRSFQCDAYAELDYIEKHCPDKPRIEYLIKNYTDKPADKIAKNFFKDLEYCTSAEDVAVRAGTFVVHGKATTSATSVTATPHTMPEPTDDKRQCYSADMFKQGKKLCKNCGTAVESGVKFCTNCGNSDFYINYEEYRKTTLKYCAKCGKPNEKNYKYCPDCGSSEFVDYKLHLENEKKRQEGSRYTKKEYSADDFEIDKGVLNKYKGQGGDVVIPDNITRFNSLTFRSTSIKSITLPNSLTKINYLLPGNLPNITDIKVYKDNEAFKSINGILYSKDGKTLVWYPAGKKDTTFIIPDCVTEICDGAFINCRYLTKINIPKNATLSSSWRIFEGCTSLTNISVDLNNPYYKSVDGNLYSKDGKTLMQYTIGKKESLFVIPTDTTNIGNYAFSDSSLKSISIPNSATSIGLNAFRDCSSLAKITIPDSVTFIKASAFDGCRGIQSIVIPKNVKYMGMRVFDNCKNLKTIYCETKKPLLSLPKGWEKNWNSGCEAKIIWGYNGK